MKAVEHGVVSPIDASWIDLTRMVPSDVYHLPGYLKSCNLAEDGEVNVAVVEKNGYTIGAPLVFRRLPYGMDGFDACTPYGYGSIIGNPDSESAWASAIKELLGRLEELDVIAVFIRLHPFLHTEEFVAALSSLGALVYHGDTVYFQLEKGDQDNWSGLKSGLRYDIKKLIKAGFEFVANDWSYFDDFQKMYRESMSRVGARDFYLFDKAYFDSLRENLGASVYLHTLLDFDGKPASAVLDLGLGSIVHGHLSGSSNEHYAMSPAKMMYNEARLWYQQNGHEIFHIGAGLGGKHDNLFHFKAGFSRYRAKLRTCGIIVDQSRYRTLVDLHHKHTGIVPDRMHDFFPAYRTPSAL